MTVNKRIWLRNLAWGTLIAVMLAACNFPRPEPERTPIAAQTSMPTPPASSTSPPTRTPFPTLTPTPTESPTPPQTPTLSDTTTLTPSPTITPTQTTTQTQTPSPTPTATATPAAFSAVVPDFSHVVVIVLENREFGSVIGHADMPNFNRWAEEYTLLTQHYAVRHPSLPNYIALISGDIQGIGTNCEDCFVDAPSLPDLLESRSYTWRTYQEGMPEPCFVGSSGDYAQKHNPFIYFDAIRLNPERCENRVVPLSQLKTDLAEGNLPDFAFITPDMCNSAHDCHVSETDDWLGKWVNRILASEQWDERSLLIITWDEGQGDHGCCNLADEAGGRVATILISDLVKKGFQDGTPYTHYSILKTIEEAWGLEKLGLSADPETPLIVEPWEVKDEG